MISKSRFDYVCRPPHKPKRQNPIPPTLFMSLLTPSRSYRGELTPRDRLRAGLSGHFRRGRLRGTMCLISSRIWPSRGAVRGNVDIVRILAIMTPTLMHQIFRISLWINAGCSKKLDPSIIGGIWPVCPARDPGNQGEAWRAAAKSPMREQDLGVRP